MATLDSDAESIALCGMTDAQIAEKHVRLRGTMDLKYPRATSACTARCGHNDNQMDKLTAHRCFLVPGHQGEHEFSSECIASRGGN